MIMKFSGVLMNIIIVILDYSRSILSNQITGNQGNNGT